MTSLLVHNSIEGKQMGMCNEIIKIDVYAKNNSHLYQDIDSLLTHGFHLNFISDLSLSSIEQSTAHLFILSTDNINDESAVFSLVSKKPFLIYSFSGSLLSNKALRLFEKSVGYISQYASVDEVAINIQLSLLRFKERKNFVERMQGLDEKFTHHRTTGIAIGLLMSKVSQNEAYILDKIKLVSRSKQRRMIDVAQDIIDLCTTENSILNQKNSNKNIEKWLMNNIIHRSNL